NPDFEGNSVKIVTATIDSENTPNSDGYIAKFTFKAVTGDEGVFILSNGYNSSVGFDTYVDFTDDIDIFSFVGNSINIDSTPVIINAAEAE
ncbi:MAG: hypothetical protein LIO59_04885, partial [Oscillospiraceae bacterium]|nr:hypothetical protein [Oscillospiraceae bacterium]